MATMADVAREANVSVATVSRLLNHQGTVSPDTAARVYDAVARLAYEPNLLARNFRKKESRVILILSPNVTNPYYAHILSGIGDAAAELGYSALICNTADDAARERDALEMLKRQRADGAILMASNMESEHLLDYASCYPLVQCSEYDPDVDIAHVSIDNQLAAQQIMEFLIGLGHTRIAIISSENNYFSTRLRLKGYQDSLHRHDLPVREEYITCAARDYSFASGKDKARALLALNPRPTAIFCISDVLAIGAITAAKELGFRVPEDVAIIGFDDVEHTMMFHPYITSVAQPCYELGRQALLMLYAQMTRAKSAPRQMTLEHRLIVRESSSPTTLLE